MASVRLAPENARVAVIEVSRIFCSLAEEQIWEIDDATQQAKLYLLALRRCGDSHRAREMADVPVDQVRVLHAWLLARGYARTTGALTATHASLAA